MVRVKIDGISSFKFGEDEFESIDGVFTIELQKLRFASEMLAFNYIIVSEPEAPKEVTEAPKEVTEAPKEVTEAPAEETKAKRNPFDKTKK